MADMEDILKQVDLKAYIGVFKAQKISPDIVNELSNYDFPGKKCEVERILFDRYHHTISPESKSPLHKEVCT